MTKLLVMLSIVLFPAILMAESPDIFEIQKTRVNLHLDADLTSPIIASFRRNRQVQELSREGNWIKVQGQGGAGREGWVYAPVVGRLTTKDSASENTPLFTKFKQVLEELNWKVKNSIGSVFFVGASDLGDGTVQVTASRSWLSTPIQYRRSNLKTIFSKWDNQVIAHQPLVIHVVDTQGQMRMSQQM